jgi:uncharacterized protein
MQIPHALLAPATLESVIVEFVTRDGTDHTVVARRIEQVKDQLDAGDAELHYDEQSGTCNIVLCGTR